VLKHWWKLAAEINSQILQLMIGNEIMLYFDECIFHKFTTAFVASLRLYVSRFTNFSTLRSLLLGFQKGIRCIATIV